MSTRTIGPRTGPEHSESSAEAQYIAYHIPSTQSYRAESLPSLAVLSLLSCSFMHFVSHSFSLSHTFLSRSLSLSSDLYQSRPVERVEKGVDAVCVCEFHSPTFLLTYSLSHPLCVPSNTDQWLS